MIIKRFVCMMLSTVFFACYCLSRLESSLFGFRNK